jgi:hypothetical protein
MNVPAVHKQKLTGWTEIPLYIALLLLVMLTAVLICLTYVRSERTIYYWDFASYHDMTLEKAEYYRSLLLNRWQGWRQVILSIRESTANEYSDFHTLPVIPFVLLFGKSRVNYILALSMIYTVPFVLLLDALTVRLLRAQPQLTFGAGAAITLFMPAAWLPTLRGYPDTGAAALMLLAVLLYLQDPTLKNPLRIAAIGLTLAFVVLFRRHFTYAVIAFVAAGGLQHLFFLYRLKGHKTELARGLSTYGLRFVLLGISFLAAMLVFGEPFVSRVLNTNFVELYASYRRPYGVVFDHFTSYYGWLVVLLSIAGVVIGLRRRVFQSGIDVLFDVLGYSRGCVVVERSPARLSLHAAFYPPDRHWSCLSFCGVRITTGAVVAAGRFTGGFAAGQFADWSYARRKNRALGRVVCG